MQELGLVETVGLWDGNVPHEASHLKGSPHPMLASKANEDPLHWVYSEPVFIDTLLYPALWWS